MTTRRTDAVTRYARDVGAGRVIAGPFVRAACARHLRDLKDARARGYTFHADLAERAFAFFRNVLRLNSGAFEGVPFALCDWQAFIVGSIFGWLDAEGVRRFQVAYIEAGKGCGKSPLAAGIGLYMLIADGEARSEVYAAASKRDQAMILFRDAVSMVDQSPALAARVLKTGGANVWNLSFNGSFFRPLASDDSQSGPRPHCALIDELHEHRNGLVLEMLRAGFKGRRSPLIFITTNAGFDRATVCWEYHEKARKVAEGTLDDDHFFAYVCALDDGDHPFEDESCWGKTNPNLGVSIRAPYLRDQVAEARVMPSKEALVRRLHFCEWTDAASPWISGEAWRACEVEPAGDMLDWLTPTDAVSLTLAVDLSLTTDLSSLAIAADVPGGMMRVATEFWTPADTLRERGDRDAIDYALWVRQGYLHAVPGSTLDYTPIAQRIADICATRSVSRVVFDRYKMPYLRRAMDELGVSVATVEHPQTFVKPKASALWMPESINQIEAAVLEHRVAFWRNPVLTWCAASAVVLTDEQGSRVFSKRKSTGRIDGLVAATMAIGALRAPALDVSLWVA